MFLQVLFHCATGAPADFFSVIIGEKKKKDTVTCVRLLSDVRLMYNVALSQELRPQGKNIFQTVPVRKHRSSVLINGITALPKINSETDLF